MTVGWLANRNALLAMICGTVALLAHDRWRKERRQRWLGLALLSLAIGLLCAEATVQALGYLLAYALFLDQGSKRQRALSLVPYAGVVAIWRGVYTALGYGAVRTDLYIDPGSDPLRFASAALGRLPRLLSAQFTGVFAETAELIRPLAPSVVPYLLPLAIGGVVAVGWLLAALFKSRADVRFWAAGMVFATVPVCAVAPSDRLLTATSLGGAALTAIVLIAIVDRAAPYHKKVAVFAGASLAFINLVLAPLLLPLRAYSVGYMGDFITYASDSVPSGPEIADKTVVMLNPPADQFGVYLPFYREVQGDTMPKQLRWLATGESDLQVTRVDDFSLKISPAAGFLPRGSQWTLRSRSTRSSVGDTLELTGVSFRVTAVTKDGRPDEVLVRFDSDLDSEKFVWLQWDRTGYVSFSPPEPGRSVWVPAARVEEAMLREQEPRHSAAAAAAREGALAERHFPFAPERFAVHSPEYGKHTPGQAPW
jgi:hypothetical protein